MGASCPLGDAGPVTRIDPRFRPLPVLASALALAEEVAQDPAVISAYFGDPALERGLREAA